MLWQRYLVMAWLWCLNMIVINMSCDPCVQGLVPDSPWGRGWQHYTWWGNDDFMVKLSRIQIDIFPGLTNLESKSATFRKSGSAAKGLLGSKSIKASTPVAKVRVCNPFSRLQYRTTPMLGWVTCNFQTDEFCFHLFCHINIFCWYSVWQALQEAQGRTMYCDFIPWTWNGSHFQPSW